VHFSFSFLYFGMIHKSCGFSRPSSSGTAEFLTLTQICLSTHVWLFLSLLVSASTQKTWSCMRCFFLSVVLLLLCYPCWTRHQPHKTLLRLFQMNKSDWANAITWVNEWFLKDWTRPNTTLRVKLIIAANSKEEKGAAAVQLMCTLTETCISILICYIEASETEGLLSRLYDNRAVSFSPSCITMCYSDKINWNP